MVNKLKKGLVQVYTGSGKGKTTAAMGISLRAAGQGLKVYIYQFLKPSGLSSGEVNFFKEFNKNIGLFRLNVSWWTLNSFKNEGHKESLRKILKEEICKLNNITSEGVYDVVVLDEVNNCLHHKLISTEDILHLINNKHEKTELILTGRNAPLKIKKVADLITEMKMVKHPFEKGINARKGIEY